MTEQYPPISSLILHSGNMVLIDKLIAAGDDGVTCVSYQQNASLFSIKTNYLPSYVCIEYMAQTIAAYAGLKAVNNNRAPTIGLLLGTRSFTSTQADIPISQPVAIKVKEAYNDQDQLVLFHCEVSNYYPDEAPLANISGQNKVNSTPFATADIKAIMPNDTRTLLNKFSHQDQH